MDEKLYDPDCSACERAQKDYADLERVTDDLAMLVRRLAHSLDKPSGNTILARQAMDYLTRNGREGSPLRKVGDGKTAQPVTEHCALGDDRCNCGGDTPGVRAGCANWKPHNAELTGGPLAGRPG